MKVEFQDEYFEVLLSQDNPGFVPAIGDMVDFDEETWRVKSRTYYPNEDLCVVLLTQGSPTVKQKDEIEGRLKEVKASILALSNRQSVTEGRVRGVREQTASIRKHINQQISKEK